MKFSSTKLIIVFIGLILCTEIKSYSFTEDEIVLILKTHNELRAKEPATNMQKLVWNPKLAKIARHWAKRCVAGHRPDRSNRAGFDQIGENLWWASFSRRNMPQGIATVLNDFYNEKRFYNFRTNKCRSKKECGHYLQLVWADTCSVGCAAAFCKRISKGRGIRSGVMVVCNYGPAGNYVGKRPYIHGKPCSGCPGTCNNGFCASKCAEQVPMFTVYDADLKRKNAAQPLKGNSQIIKETIKQYNAEASNDGFTNDIPDGTEDSYNNEENSSDTEIQEGNGPTDPPNVNEEISRIIDFFNEERAKKLDTIDPDKDLVNSKDTWFAAPPAETTKKKALACKDMHPECKDKRQCKNNAAWARRYCSATCYPAECSTGKEET